MVRLTMISNKKILNCTCGEKNPENFGPTCYAVCRRCRDRQVEVYEANPKRHYCACVCCKDTNDINFRPRSRHLCIKCHEWEGKRVLWEIKKGTDPAFWDREK